MSVRACHLEVHQKDKQDGILQASQHTTGIHTEPWSSGQEEGKDLWESRGGNHKPGSGRVECQIQERPLGGTVLGQLEWRTRAWERAGLADGFESCSRGGGQSHACE